MEASKISLGINLRSSQKFQGEVDPSIENSGEKPVGTSQAAKADIFSVICLGFDAQFRQNKF